MKCPFCNHMESKVTDSRFHAESNAIRRRRECLDCSNRFTTFETIDLTIEVKKRDGTYEDFDQNKLIRGIQAASRHSKMNHDQAQLVVNRITEQVIMQQKREISSQELGELVMQHLKKVDGVAYVRFACVYNRLKHIDDLQEAIRSIEPKDC